jgi:hypothetical protein
VIHQAKLVGVNATDLPWADDERQIILTALTLLDRQAQR